MGAEGECESACCVIHMTLVPCECILVILGVTGGEKSLSGQGYLYLSYCTAAQAKLVPI